MIVDVPMETAEIGIAPSAPAAPFPDRRELFKLIREMLGSEVEIALRAQIRYAEWAGE